MRACALVLLLIIGLAPRAEAQMWYCDPLRVYYPTVPTCPAPWRSIAQAPVDPPSTLVPIELSPTSSRSIPESGFSSRGDTLDEWCATAKLPSSIAICSDPDLRDLALERQRAFDDARSRLKPEQQKELLTNQNGWVRSYARECGLTNQSPALPISQSLKQCLLQAGKFRTSYLQTYGLPAASILEPAASAIKISETPAAPPSMASLQSDVDTLIRTQSQATATTVGTIPITSSSNDGGAWVGLLIIAGIIIVSTISIKVTVHIAKARRHRETTRLVSALISSAISEHLQTLQRKRLQTMYKDPYGNIITKDWEKEIQYFIDNVLKPQAMSLGDDGYALFLQTIPSLYSLIDLATLQNSPSSPAMSLGFGSTPRDFEFYCAEQLKLGGWDAQATKGSGDQGTDVIAEKHGVRLVVQCKFYSQPVGNKAVQEISAARLHEGADYAAVVSNASYTRSARQLATTNKVMLLHYNELRNIDDLIAAEAY